MEKDRYRFFRIEAQELVDGLGRGLLGLERESSHELVRDLLRQAHTLKGASRVVGQAGIGELAHRIEDVLTSWRAADGPAGRETVDRGLRLIDEIRGQLHSLSLPPEDAAQSQTPKAQPEEAFQSIRVDIGEMDALMRTTRVIVSAAALVRGCGARLDEARRRARSLGRVRGSGSKSSMPREIRQELDQLAGDLDRTHQSLLDHSEQMARGAEEIRDTVGELRLVPARPLLDYLERAVRDAANSLGKQVTLRTTGATTRIDAHVVDGLRTALLHVVRNAVAHGIEDDAARLQSGKPLNGTISISIERRGHRVAIVCSDDGRGFDLASARRVAVARGLVPEPAAGALDAPEVIRMLLRGGVSTSAGLTVVSGRGIGLNVVRETVRKLRGEIDIRTSPGAGTDVEIIVPVSLTSLPALVAEVGGTTVLIPLDSVRRTLSITPADLTVSSGGSRILVEGDLLPFKLLQPLLGSAPSADRSGARIAIVLEASGEIFAIGVDALHGIETAVVQGLPDAAAASPVVAGAALDEAGAPQLVLAPEALAGAEAGAEASHAPRARAPELPPLLVIDDSLTTRMLERSILESARYEVDLAVSAEEAIQKAKVRRYGLFIVDVEMPGMSGFEFIALTRGDPELRDIPSILVTSRADPEDKRRGKEAGARAYIVKSQFDQQQLLEAVRRLVG